MKSLFLKASFLIIVFVLMGIFFSSSRTIIHANSNDNNQQSNFLERYINLKEIYNENRSDDLSSDVCQKIEDRVINRHHLRWVFEKVRLIIFDQFDHNNNGKKLSYIYSIILTFLLGASFFFSILTISGNLYHYIDNHKLNFIFLFLIFFFFISFYSFRENGETRFSFFEIFFLSAGLYFTKIKNKLLFLITISLATLNRESGILISSIWLLINGFNIIDNKIKLEKDNLIFGVFSGFFCVLILIIFNYQIFSCGFNLNLFFFEDLEQNIKASLLSKLNIIFYNVILIIFLLYFFWVDFNKQFKLLIIILLYNFVFLFFSKLDNNILRIMLAPLFVVYCNQFLIKKLNK
tara:strand:- start:201 stop:1247 length:1047 start_codon:yes stop_codon:yes gene_type:complete